jgi:N-methylhydantoinase A
MSDLTSEFSAAFFTTTRDFAFAAINEMLAGLRAKCHEFIEGPGSSAIDSEIEFFVEARYPHQIWELEVPLTQAEFHTSDDVDELRRTFHAVHLEVFAINDPASHVEFVTWQARARCRLRKTEPDRPRIGSGRALDATRVAYFHGLGCIKARACLFEALRPGDSILGPAIIESPTTTVVIEPGALATRTKTGSLSILPWGANVGVGKLNSAD